MYSWCQERSILDLKRSAVSNKYFTSGWYVARRSPIQKRDYSCTRWNNYRKWWRNPCCSRRVTSCISGSSSSWGSISGASNIGGCCRNSFGWDRRNRASSWQHWRSWSKCRRSCWRSCWDSCCWRWRSHTSWGRRSNTSRRRSWTSTRSRCSRRRWYRFPRHFRLISKVSQLKVGLIHSLLFWSLIDLASSV